MNNTFKKLRLYLYYYYFTIISIYNIGQLNKDSYVPEWIHYPRSGLFRPLLWSLWICDGDETDYEDGNGARLIGSGLAAPFQDGNCDGRRCYTIAAIRRVRTSKDQAPNHVVKFMLIIFNFITKGRRMNYVNTKVFCKRWELKVKAISKTTVTSFKRSSRFWHKYSSLFTGLFTSHLYASIKSSERENDLTQIPITLFEFLGFVLHSLTHDPTTTPATCNCPPRNREPFDNPRPLLRPLEAFVLLLFPPLAFTEPFPGYDTGEFDNPREVGGGIDEFPGSGTGGV
ncbi:hypothetical protein Avbf_00389 [Armadillidium vulgare]|nr:hypothetical protein Avbf_00389 [Armadillidium vulgare]